MTVEMQTQRVLYQGNGVASSFPFAFTVYAPEQVRVVTADTTGKETERVFTTDYSVDLAERGGTVSFPLSGPPLAAGEKIAIISAIPSTQEATFPNNTPYYQEQIEGGLDRTVRLIQQLEESVSRAILAPVSSESGGGEIYVDALLKANEESKQAAASASADAERAETAADRAERESGKILTLSVSAHKSPNENVAADYTPETGMLHLYIPQGERGEAGPQGPRGETGSRGEAGEQGPQGMQGGQGEQGIRGLPGEGGAPGPRGLRGEVGPRGAQGEIGPEGVQGPQGPQGERGEQGLAGPQGPKGESGDVTTALEASLLQFTVDSEGNLLLNYLGTAAPEHIGTYCINPQSGELEVTYA